MPLPASLAACRSLHPPPSAVLPAKGNRGAIYSLELVRSSMEAGTGRIAGTAAPARLAARRASASTSLSACFLAISSSLARSASACALRSANARLRSSSLAAFSAASRSVRSCSSRLRCSSASRAIRSCILRSRCSLMRCRFLVSKSRSAALRRLSNSSWRRSASSALKPS